MSTHVNELSLTHATVPHSTPFALTRMLHLLYTSLVPTLKVPSPCYRSLSQSLWNYTISQPLFISLPTFLHIMIQLSLWPASLSLLPSFTSPSVLPYLIEVFPVIEILPLAPSSPQVYLPHSYTHPAHFIRLQNQSFIWKMEFNANTCHVREIGVSQSRPR